MHVRWCYLTVISLACLSAPARQQDADARPRGFQAALDAEQRTTTVASAPQLQPSRPQHRAPTGASPAAIQKQACPPCMQHEPCAGPVAQPGPCQLSVAEWAWASVAATLLFAAGVALGALIGRQDRRARTADQHKHEAVASFAGEEMSEACKAATTADGQAAAAAMPTAAAPAHDSIAAQTGAAATSVRTEPAVSSVKTAAYSVLEASNPDLDRGTAAEPAAPALQCLPELETAAVAAIQPLERVSTIVQQQCIVGNPVEQLAEPSTLNAEGAGSPAAQPPDSASALHAGPEAASTLSVSSRAGDTTEMAGVIVAGGVAGVQQLHTPPGVPPGDVDMQAAAHLVASLTSHLHLKIDELVPAERLQLVKMVVQAWGVQSARRIGESVVMQGSEAHQLKVQDLERKERQEMQERSRDAQASFDRRAHKFRELCSETLWCGLAIMVAAGARQALHRGLLHGIFAHCSGLPRARGWAGWGLWAAAWRTAEVAECYVLAGRDALLGLGVLFAAPWLLYRTGLLSDYHALPVTKLLVGLGLVCGSAGYVAVEKLGGDCSTWLAAWEAWVVLHIVFWVVEHNLNTAAMQRHSSTAVPPGVMYPKQCGWLTVMMWLVLGLLLPIAAGVLLFRS